MNVCVCLCCVYVVDKRSSDIHLISGLTFCVCVLGQEDAALIHSKLNCVHMCTSGIQLYQLCKYTVEQTDETAWLLHGTVKGCNNGWLTGKQTLYLDVPFRHIRYNIFSL